MMEEDNKKTPEQESGLTQEIKPGMLKKLPMKDTKKTLTAVVSAFLVVLAGMGTGFILSGSTSAEKSPSSAVEITKDVKTGRTEAGITDEETFRDSAEGLLVKGGIDGEGTHHLDRGLGDDKYVYLTSTVIDLESFTGKKVKVWGETISAQKAGWLMDVGKIQVTK